MNRSISYRSIDVDGLSIFYREAGSPDAPALQLLHGLSSSSRMYQSLLERLADQFHLIAPDYPGFGHSEWPAPDLFEYTFDSIATVMNRFAEVIGLTRFTLFMQDYGGPVGFRMALAYPEKIEGLIVQNAVVHEEGLGPLWETRRAFWRNRTAHEAELQKNLLSLEAARTRHLGSDPNLDLYNPDLWWDEFHFLNSPNQHRIQSDLFFNYRTNLEEYPKWQQWLRQTQPRLLVLWGKYDPSFDISEPDRFLNDVPNAKIHILEAGHFALDTKAEEIATTVRSFL